MPEQVQTLQIEKENLKYKNEADRKCITNKEGRSYEKACGHTAILSLTLPDQGHSAPSLAALLHLPSKPETQTELLLIFLLFL